MDRRGFLRFLGLGAAAAVAAPIIKPKAFFSFFSGEAPVGEVVVATDLAGMDELDWTCYFVKWGEGKVYGIYPRGENAGIDVVTERKAFRIIASTDDTFGGARIT
jgi:hypothetical protein